MFETCLALGITAPTMNSCTRIQSSEPANTRRPSPRSARRRRTSCRRNVRSRPIYTLAGSTSNRTGASREFQSSHITSPKIKRALELSVLARWWSGHRPLCLSALSSGRKNDPRNCKTSTSHSKKRSSKNAPMRLISCLHKSHKWQQQWGSNSSLDLQTNARLASRELTCTFNGSWRPRNEKLSKPKHSYFQVKRRGLTRQPTRASKHWAFGSLTLPWASSAVSRQACICSGINNSPSHHYRRPT